MGTAVLRAHDCIKPHTHLDSCPPLPMNTFRKKPIRSPPASKTRTVRSKTNPTLSRKVENSKTRKPLVMGQVTILKRGDDPNPKPKPIPESAVAVDGRSYGGESSVLCSTNRLGTDPKILPKFSDLKSIYAGPAFTSSPAPSALPFPAFFVKGGGNDVIKSANATRGLKFLLRLDEIA